MNREKLRRHKRNMTELASVLLAIGKLQEELEWVKEEHIVSGKVKKSGTDPKRTEPIRARLRKKEQRKAELESEMQEVEAFIASFPDGMDKQIFEMVHLDGMTQRKVGEVLGYSEGRISQIISKYLKD